MATKRFRSGGYQYTIKNKKVLPKPIYLTYKNEAEGDAYVKELEYLLSKGIVPIQFQPERPKVKLHEIINEYIRAEAISDDNRQLLEVVKKRIQNIDTYTITYRWSESWVKDMKRVRKLAPGTIRKHVGALSHCLDWAVKRKYLDINPLKSLSKNYSNYSSDDTKLAGINRRDIERDRRLEDGEEERILKVIDGLHKPKMFQRNLIPEPTIVYRTFFLLALETAMRMRELYTLKLEQVEFNKKTIFLEGTKNGDKRQVPMSTTAIKLLQDYIEQRNLDEYLFPEFFDGKHTEVGLKKNTYRNSRRWGRVFKHAECPGFKFHDLRHEAISRIYERTTMSDIEIAKITGHRTLNTLKRYANLRGSDLSNKMW